MQKRHNSIAIAMELCLFCIKPLICKIYLSATKSASYICPRLTHWGQVTHICVSKLTVIDLDNGLSPGWRQAIIWANTGILLIGLLGKNFNEFFIKIHTFSFKKIHLKMLSGKWRPFCLGLNVLMLLCARVSADTHIIIFIYIQDQNWHHYFMILQTLLGLLIIWVNLG